MTYTVYTKESCQGCTFVKNLLSDLEFDYVELKLDEDFTLEEYEDKFGPQPCPGILKDDELIGGTGMVVQLMQYLEELNLVQRETLTELPEEELFMADKNSTMIAP